MFLCLADIKTMQNYILFDNFLFRSFWTF